MSDSHDFSDVDAASISQHHTLGTGPAQASPGNHTHDGKNSLVSPLLTTPPGTIIIWPGTSTAPANWLYCDGSSLLRTDYPALFTVLGTSFGAVDGTHFSLPDLRGRFPVGRDGSAEFPANGQTGGSKAAHSHTLSANGWAMIVAVTGSPSIFMRRVAADLWAATVSFLATGQTVAASSSTFTLGADLGGNTDATQVLPPYLTVNYLIRYQ